MSRKAVKLILFIPGAVIAVFWFVLFFMSMWHFVSGSEGWEISLLTIFAVIIAGLVPMSIAMLMHSKDIIQKKQGFAVFLKVLAIVWLAYSALISIWVLVTSLIYGWDAYTNFFI